MVTSTKTRTVARGVALAAASVLVVAACSGGGGGAPVDDATSPPAEGNGSEGSGSTEDELVAALAEMDPVTLSYANQGPAALPQSVALDDFFNEIETRTEGKVTIDRYWSGSLVPGAEILSAVSSGLADMGSTSTSFYPQDLPVSTFVLQLASAQAESYPVGYLQGYGATAEMFQRNEALQQEFAHHGAHLLGAEGSAPYSPLCTRPVETLDDANGLRARVGGNIWGQEVEALGMQASFIEVPEIYEAAQRGILECIVLQANSFGGLSLWEVATYFTPINGSPFPGSVHMVNLEVWEALPVPVQHLFSELFTTYYVERSLGATLGAQAEFADVGVTEHGIEFVNPSQLDGPLAEHQAGAREAAIANAPAAAGDGAAFAAEWEALLAKWYEIVTDDLGVPVVERDPDAIREAYLNGRDQDVAPMAERLVEELGR